MSDKKEHMEDFFKKAMDNFNEVPSEKVWDKIQENIIEERSIWQKFFNWKTDSSPLLLLVF